MFSKRIAIAIMALLPLTVMAAAKDFTLTSPRGNISAQIKTGKQITWSVSFNGTKVIAPSEVAMYLMDGTAYDGSVKFQKAVKASVDETVSAVVYKKAKVRNHYNQLTLKFKTFDIVFRAYDQGLAYRFVSKASAPFQVRNEKASFNFAGDWKAFIPYVSKKNATREQQFFNSFENIYAHENLSAWQDGRLAFLPLAVQGPDGMLINITESDLKDYPGMYLYNNEGKSSLEGVYAPYPKEVEQGGHIMIQKIVKSREEYIAKAAPGQSFPWRIVTITANDAQMQDNDMVFNLSRPQANVDWSWVKPGKVAWDWWNDWNIYGVDFVSGVNTQTYKYFIDFASGHGIEYVIMDEGWAVPNQADLYQVIPEIDLQEIIDYGKSKNVGIILWAGYWAVARDIDGIFKHFADMGVKGFKIDFMDRDDQQMMDFYWDAAEIAAKYHLMVDFHGAFKPAGLLRTYPNVVNKEGVHGLEQLKWGKEDQVTYDVTIPFVRMVAGPFDYTQGAMRNANKKNYYPVNTEPMSQGTRCRQLAEYVIFEAPFTMLCDSPSNYIQEAECTAFISSVPTVWDETRALDGKIAEYSVIARRNGDSWYVGALTNWDARDMKIDLGFLPAGNYKVEIFRDGANADKAARDYVREEKDIDISSSNHILDVHMAPGGGWVAKISK